MAQERQKKLPCVIHGAIHQDPSSFHQNEIECPSSPSSFVLLFVVHQDPSSQKSTKMAFASPSRVHQVLAKPQAWPSLWHDRAIKFPSSFCSHPWLFFHQDDPNLDGNLTRGARCAIRQDLHCFPQVSISNLEGLFQLQSSSVEGVS